MSDAETRERALAYVSDFRGEIEAGTVQGARADWLLALADALAASMERERQLEDALDGLVNSLLRTSPGHLDTPAGKDALAALSSRPGSAANTETP